MSNVLEALKWRYATKQFDTEKKLNIEQVARLKEVLRLSPSSFGLQPWRFIFVESETLRAKLRVAGYDQPQFTEASHLVVLATETHVDTALVQKYVQHVADTKHIAIGDLAGLSEMLNGAIGMKGEDGARDWAARQVYIALGVLLTATALEGIDAAPMEGFDPLAVDTILGLTDLGLASRVVVGLGFRSPHDQAATAPKVRYSEAEVCMVL